MQHVMRDFPFFNRSVEAGFANHIIVQPGELSACLTCWP
jgi:hypothetical protein